jgi:MoaA/NifB/PqqE/SkfB family radical SAM enzyme
MKTQITPMKLARFKEILTGPVRPIHWDVDPSSVCDHRCRGCPYIFDGSIDPMLGVARPESAKEKRTFLDYDRFERFLEEAAAHGGKAITFVGGGEPTLHPRFPLMMAAAIGKGFKFGVVTHLGRQYPRTFFDALALATWVRVSVNAGSPETYLKHQGRDDFDRMAFNTEEAAKRDCRVGWSFLITNDNYKEITAAARWASAVGAKYIQYKPIIEVDLGKAYEGLEEAITHELRGAADYADDSFQILDQWSVRLVELRQHTRGEFKGRCHVPRFNPKLGANGVVYTCCELAYSVEGAIGSIYDEPLSAILERAGQKVMEMHDCPHCWDKPINTIINEGRIGEVVAPLESGDQEFV